MAAAEGIARTRVVRVAVATGFAVLVAQSAADLVAILGFHSYGSLFDLARSNGLADIVSVMVILSAALGAAVLATRLEGARLLAAVLSFVLACVAIADVEHYDASGPYSWDVAATLVVAALLTLGLALRISGMPRTALVLGTVLLAIDVKFAFAYDQLMNLTGSPALVRGDVLYELGVVLDEGIELAAWLLLSVGLWLAMLQARHAETGPKAAAPDARRTASRSRGRPRRRGA